MARLALRELRRAAVSGTIAMLFACRIGSCQAMTSEFPDPASLASELRNLQGSINQRNAREIRAALPSAWNVHTPEGNYSLSTERLRAALNQSPSSGKAWLNQMAGELEEYSEPARTTAGARTDLERILARPEFAGNGPPSAWDRFRERIAAWIEHWFRYLSNLARKDPLGFRVIFWLVIVAAVGLTAFWIFRLWRRDNYELHLSGSPVSASPRSWKRWLQAAAAASNQGDFRQAIQCAYWAGVSRLQESGALPCDLAHTPREYIRLLATAEKDLLASSAVVSPMRTLTSSLERFWYGRGAATDADFSACLACLEALGCRAD